VSRSLASSRLLTPSTLAAIDDLALVARLIVEGFLAGEHRDRRPGAGVEFSQYRSYQPGDDLRKVDWRAYGRCDRFYVRESEVERDVTVRLVLDASASMAHEDSGLSKLAYARLLIAALAYLAERQGDRIAFHAVQDSSSMDLPAARGRHSLSRVLHRLDRLEAVGSWPPWELLGARIARTRECELVVVVSDLYQTDGEMLRALEALRALGHEVLVLHLMGRNELDFSYVGDHAFVDLESGATVTGNPAVMRAAYLERMAVALARWRETLLEAGVGYTLSTLDTPIDGALRACLARRARLP